MVKRKCYKDSLCQLIIPTKSTERLITVSGNGLVTLSDRFECVDRMLHDKSMPALSSILIDVRYFTNSPSPSEVPWIGQLINRLRTRFLAKVAIVTSTVGHVTVSQLIAFEADSMAKNVKAFTSLSEAIQWLIEMTV